MRTILVLIVLHVAAAGNVAAQSALLASATRAAQNAASTENKKNPAARLLDDEWSDIKQMFTPEAATWLAVGGAAALAAHPLDDNVHEYFQEHGTTTLPGAFEWGSQLLQVPLAVAWWSIGAATGHDHAAEVGRDLLRAQASVYIFITPIKYAADRTRPNDEPRSFPSGHSAASFATAAVLQQHYGWRGGVPAYGMAIYTAVSRLTVDQHWLSDVTFGAALGMVCGRNVTVRLRETSVSVTPVIDPDRTAVFVTVMR